MTLLLDTHVLLWWLADDPALGKKARAAISDAQHSVWVSAASVWEIAIKSALGRLSMPGPVAEVLPRALSNNDFSPLAITVEHALCAGDLPPIHADPFDRMLVAQAITHAWTLVTADAIVARYPVKTLAA